MKFEILIFAKESEQNKKRGNTPKLPKTLKQGVSLCQQKKEIRERIKSKLMIFIVPT